MTMIEDKTCIFCSPFRCLYTDFLCFCVWLCNRAAVISGFVFLVFPTHTRTFPSARKRNLSILRIYLLFWIFYFYFQACCLLINASHVIVILILKLVISELVTFSYFILRFDIVVLNVQLCICSLYIIKSS